MSEELLQRGLIDKPEKIGKWDFYNLGSTSVKSLKEYDIIRNIDYGDEEKKKIDALIVQKKNVIAVIEYKKPSEFKTEKQKNKAVEQELKVAKKLSAHIIIATDTKDTIWVNVLTGNRIKDENGKEIKTNFNPKDEKLPDLIDKIRHSINEVNDKIKPRELINPTDLAKQIWQDIWSVSGAAPENCLYTFIELFIFKYLSDLNVLKGIYNFSSVIDSFETNTAEEILENYASVIRPKIKELFPENPIDKTTIINGTIFVSKDQKAIKGYSTVFKKVLQRFHNYGKLEHIEYDFKSLIFESFLKQSISKKNWGQFFTPLKVVRAIIKMAKDDIKEGIVICDPACGVGKFLLEGIKNKLGYFYEVSKGKINANITIHGFDKGFDTEEQKTIILAKANMLIYFSDLIKEHPELTNNFAELFNKSFTLKTNSMLGTLSEPLEEKYDLILTNPPYVTSGSSNLKEEIRKDGELVNYYKINALGVEGLFIEWIIRALKPNGKAFIVVPDGIFNRQHDKNLRQFIIDECYINGIISLPIKTFFTTPKKTYILSITKKTDKKDTQTDPVFTYFVNEIGESRDVYRFDIDQDDLSEAVTLYCLFKGNKQGFEKINQDKKCKIQSFTKFNPQNHWSIERWWTENEKIELGIIEEQEKMNIVEFSNFLGEFANTLIEYQSPLKELAEDEKEINYKSVSIIELFDILSVPQKLNKKDIRKGGLIPVYSSQIDNYGIVGYTEKSMFNADVNNPLITFGDHTRAIYIRTTPFSVLDNVKVLRLKKPFYNKIDIEYICYQWHPSIQNLGYSRHWKEAKNVMINVPIISGEFDLKSQKYIADKYRQLDQIKREINKHFKMIEQINVITDR